MSQQAKLLKYNKNYDDITTTYRRVRKWIHFQDLLPLQNYIVFGDSGGDTFVKKAENETDLVEKLKDHLDGDTGCDFDTSIYLIVRNANKVSIRDFIK